MDEDTHMGIDFMRYGLYVSIVMNVLFGIFFLSWSYDPKGDPTDFTCFIAIFGLAAGILFLIGIYKIYSGKEYVSFEHEKKVNIAVALIIIGFIFGMISPSLKGGSLKALKNSMLIRSGTDLIQQIGYALASVLLVYEIAGKKARKYLYSGASVLILASLFRLAWSIFWIPQEGEVLDALMTTLRMLSLLMLFLAAGYFLMSVGYTRTVKSPASTTRSSSQTSKTDYGAISSKKECPNCGSEEFTKYLDGSGYCESCGKSFKSDQGSKSGSEQGSNKDRPS